jgi:hypothetical protein
VGVLKNILVGRTKNKRNQKSHNLSDCRWSMWLDLKIRIRTLCGWWVAPDPRSGSAVQVLERLRDIFIKFDKIRCFLAFLLSGSLAAAAEGVLFDGERDPGVRSEVVGHWDTRRQGGCWRAVPGRDLVLASGRNRC